MAREYSEFSFNDDIELMNLTYQMNTGNFINYYNEDLLDNEEIQNIRATKNWTIKVV